ALTDQVDPSGLLVPPPLPQGLGGIAGLGLSTTNNPTGLAANGGLVISPPQQSIPSDLSLAAFNIYVGQTIGPFADGTGSVSNYAEYYLLLQLLTYRPDLSDVQSVPTPFGPIPDVTPGSDLATYLGTQSILASLVL